MALLSLLVTCAACSGGNSPSASKKTTTTTTTAPVLSAPQGLLDPTCNHGETVQIEQQRPFLAQLFSTTTPNGDIVVGVYATGQGNNTFTLHAFFPNCSVDRQFGIGGIANVTLPAPTEKDSISAMTPDGSGGLLLVGSSVSGWLVERVTATGHMDSGFGAGGAVSLDPPSSSPHNLAAASAATVAIEPSGTIIVGGIDNCSHYCRNDWIAALTPQGRLDTAFGQGGWGGSFDPTGSSVDQLLVQPDGSIVVNSSLVFAGCGGPSLTELTSQGSVIASFHANFEQAWGRIQTAQYFDGSLFSLPSGEIGFIGGGEQNCHSASPSSSFGQIAGFLPSGILDAGFATGSDTFPAPFGGIDAISLSDGDVLLVVHQSTSGSNTLDLFVFTGSGHLDTAFGQQGETKVELPNAGFETPVTAAATSGGVVIATFGPTALDMAELSL